MDNESSYRQERKTTITSEDVLKLNDKDFWRLNDRQNSFSLIEWTPKLGGWVRAKLDCLSDWHYVNCEHILDAIWTGLDIINKQKKKREELGTERYENTDYYNGA